MEGPGISHYGSKKGFRTYVVQDSFLPYAGLGFTARRSTLTGRSLYFFFSICSPGLPCFRGLPVSRPGFISPPGLTLASSS